jgi:metal-responsive CopG/Arc/MetJ family transcriptional regulator
MGEARTGEQNKIRVAITIEPAVCRMADELAQEQRRSRSNLIEHLIDDAWRLAQIRKTIKEPVC